MLSSLKKQVSTNELVLRVVRNQDTFKISSPRKLEPTELLQILTNILKMIPDEMRDTACSVAMETVRENA